jgi:hypothetical protein
MTQMMLGRKPYAVQEIYPAYGGGRIWIAGGLDENGATYKSVVSFDPEALSNSPPRIELRAEPDLLEARHHIALVWCNDELYAIGGMVDALREGTETSEFKAMADCWVLRGGEWVAVRPLCEPRAAFFATAFGKTIVVVGGQGAQELAMTTDIYDVATDTWRHGPGLAEPREHLAGFVHDSVLFAVSGRLFGLDKGVGSVERYDLKNHTWLSRSSAPRPLAPARGGLTTSLVGDVAYAIGGEMETHVLDTVQAYDVRQNAWVAHGTLPKSGISPQLRHGHGAVAVGSTIYVIGGANRPNYGAVDTILTLTVP